MRNIFHNCLPLHDGRPELSKAVFLLQHPHSTDLNLRKWNCSEVFRRPKEDLDRPHKILKTHPRDLHELECESHLKSLLWPQGSRYRRRTVELQTHSVLGIGIAIPIEGTFELLQVCKPCVPARSQVAASLLRFNLVSLPQPTSVLIRRDGNPPV
jgi:hypothetical protein